MGLNNTAIGYGAIPSTISAGNNTSIGINSGTGLVVGNANTFLGAATSSANNVSNSTAVGYNAAITGSNQIVLGTVNETTIIVGDASLNGAVRIDGDMTV